MSNYYILKFVVLENQYFAERVDVSNQEIIDLKLDGVSFKNKRFKIKLKKHRGNIHNTIPNLYSFPVVSQTIANVLFEHCAKEIEILEVEVERKINQKYYFLNILNNLDAFDFQNSIYTELIPGIKVLKKIDKLVLDTSKIKERHIFRLSDFSTSIIISDILKNKLEDLQLTEFDFTAIDNFTFELGSYDPT